MPGLGLAASQHTPLFHTTLFSVNMCDPFESTLSLDDCLSFAAQLLLLFLMNMFMDPQINALLGFHFQLDSICSKMFNESI